MFLKVFALTVTDYTEQQDLPLLSTICICRCHHRHLEVLGHVLFYQGLYGCDLRPANPRKHIARV